MLPLLVAAADKVTPLEKLQNVSGQFWIKVFLVIVVFAAIIFLFKKLAGANKIILTIVLAVVCSIFCINWVYNRNEPPWMTWLIEPIANTGLFPTKGAYDEKQNQDPGKPGPKKNPAPATPAKK